MTTSRGIVLGHSSADTEAAVDLREDLQTLGYSVRLYELDKLSGGEVLDALQIIKQTDYFIIVLSRAMAQSRFASEELTVARLQDIEDAQTIVIPLLYESTVTPSVMARRTYADFTESYTRGLDELEQALRENHEQHQATPAPLRLRKLGNRTEQLARAFAGNDELYLVIDVGGTKAYISLMTPEGDRLFNSKYTTQAHGDQEALLQFILSSIRSSIKEIREEIHVPTPDVERRVTAVGVAFAGPTDSHNGIVRAASNFTIKDFPLSERLSEALNNKPVYVGNDADLGVLGEHWRGVAQGYTDIIGIVIGTGIGGGIIIDGQPYTGARSAAGEIGHIVVDMNSPHKCGCGQYGCFEILASRKAMVRDLRALKLSRKKTDIRWEERNLGSNFIASLVRKGDNEALEVVTKAAEICGKAVFSLLNIFNPDLVFFGGGLVPQLGEFFLEPVRAEAKKCMNSIYEFQGETVPVVMGKLPNPMLAGACLFASRGHLVMGAGSSIVEAATDGLDERDLEVLRSIAGEPAPILPDSGSDFYKVRLRALRDHGLIATDTGRGISRSSEVKITRLGRVIANMGNH